MDPANALQLLQQTANDYVATLPPAARSCTSQALSAACASIGEALKALAAPRMALAGAGQSVADVSNPESRAG
jgi:hypothetical protein